jgi:hypothetical protein
MFSATPRTHEHVAADGRATNTHETTLPHDWEQAAIGGESREMVPGHGPRQNILPT